MDRELQRILRGLDLGGEELLPTIRFGDEFVYRFVVRGSSCLEVYSAIEEQGAGYRPVLVDEAQLSWSFTLREKDYLTLSYSVDKVMEESLEVDCEEWFDVRRKYTVRLSDPASGRRSGYRHSNDVFVELTDDKGRFLDRISVVLFPVRETREVTAFWGEDFMIDSTWTLPVHVAVLRRWRNLWGAEIVTWAPDKVELRAGRRPASFEEAMGLAWEHYCYADDIFYERFSQHRHPAFESLEDLAENLLRSDVWWLYWD